MGGRLPLRREECEPVTEKSLLGDVFAGEGAQQRDPHGERGVCVGRYLGENVRRVFVYGLDDARFLLLRERGRPYRLFFRGDPEHDIAQGECPVFLNYREGDPNIRMGQLGGNLLEIDFFEGEPVVSVCGDGVQEHLDGELRGKDHHGPVRFILDAIPGGVDKVGTPVEGRADRCLVVSVDAFFYENDIASFTACRQQCPYDTEKGHACPVWITGVTAHSIDLLHTHFTVVLPKGVKCKAVIKEQTVECPRPVSRFKTGAARFCAIGSFCATCLRDSPGNRARTHIITSKTLIAYNHFRIKDHPANREPYSGHGDRSLWSRFSDHNPMVVKANRLDQENRSEDYPLTSSIHLRYAAEPLSMGMLTISGTS
ncbi:hypothetical protein SCFA_170001 [anaerobic digester metagenome]|uniref:Uncharacterized protein n=1 Tax=anaerobic digester metagenome TaxID=1263854 RepID=A0A485LY57_9ZZZZ